MVANATSTLKSRTPSMEAGLPEALERCRPVLLRLNGGLCVERPGAGILNDLFFYLFFIQFLVTCNCDRKGGSSTQLFDVESKHTSDYVPLAYTLSTLGRSHG